MYDYLRSLYFRLEAHCLKADEMSQMTTVTSATLITYFICREKHPSSIVRRYCIDSLYEHTCTALTKLQYIIISTINKTQVLVQDASIQQLRYCVIYIPVCVA